MSPKTSTFDVYRILFVILQITEANLPSWKKMYALEETARVERETSYFKKDENQTPIDKEDTIRGYRFGSTLVPFSGTYPSALNVILFFCSVCLKPVVILNRINN